MMDYKDKANKYKQKYVTLKSHEEIANNKNKINKKIKKIKN